MRVVKVGGRAQGDARLAAALAAVSRASPRMTGGLCVVHGGGDEVSALQRRLGLEPTFHGGRRVTRADDLDVVRMVLSGTINKRLTAQLISAGVCAVGVSGEDASLFLSHATDVATMGCVGEQVHVDPSLVRHLLAGGFVPVVSPLARDADDPSGAGLNVNGDDAAAALAAALGADELVLIADVPGVLQDGRLIRTLGEAEARGLILSGVAAGGMAAKLEAALEAARGGVPSVRITGIEGIGDVAAGTKVALHSSVS